ncbi:hypothetical protein ACFQZJ_09600 [Maribacter chungangensis]|uniref:DUF4249 domain-containing protein n=1 Tax=Maribacter chungangensis TaxID=1069117 RepID=A0ABW3B3L1_9FLAO
MHKYTYILAILFIFISCEDVIDVELDTEPSRLNVDAVIRLDTSKSITTATVKVGLSSSFFEENQAVSVDRIVIENAEYQGTDAGDQNTLVFNETETGVYEASKNTAFFTSGALVMTINYEGAVFEAKTNFTPSVPFDSLVQGDAVLFSGDETEIVVSFTDIPDMDNFYVFDFDFNEFLVSEDEFYPGQRFEFSYFYEDLEPGSRLNISILGADEGFFNYMNQLIVQSGGNQGPFQTPLGTVRGNFTNVSETKEVDRRTNFALGYFAVVQEFKETITIQ